jgi:hypothetical protein
MRIQCLWMALSSLKDSQIGLADGEKWLAQAGNDDLACYPARSIEPSFPIFPPSLFRHNARHDFSTTSKMRILTLASLLLATNHCLRPKISTPAAGRASRNVAERHSRFASCFARAQDITSDDDGVSYGLHLLADPEDADIE